MKFRQLRHCLTSAALLASGAAFAAGSISGVVGFHGTAPKPEKLNRKSDAFCAKTDKVDPTVTLSKDGKALANVLVRIVKNAPPATTKPTAPVTIDQNECMFLPRVQGAVEGQKLAVRNSDATLHNVHAYAGTKTLFNTAQPPKAPSIEKDPKSKDVVKIKCDVHPWMSAYIVYSPHSFFATSGEDGKFEIKDVPAGTYTVEAWHEKFGTQTAEVKVEDGKPSDPKFSFGDKKS